MLALCLSPVKAVESSPGPWGSLRPGGKSEPPAFCCSPPSLAPTVSAATWAVSHIHCAAHLHPSLLPSLELPNKKTFF